jgi:hypothetical protein
MNPASFLKNLRIFLYIFLPFIKFFVQLFEKIFNRYGLAWFVFLYITIGMQIPSYPHVICTKDHSNQAYFFYSLISATKS